MGSGIGKSVSRKVLIWLVPMMAVGYLAFGLIIYRFEYNQVTTNQTQMVKKINEQSNLALRIWLEEQVHIVRQIAEEPRVIEACLNPGDPIVLQRATDYLMTLFNLYGYFENFPVAIKLEEGAFVEIDVKGEKRRVKNGQYILDTLGGQLIGGAGTHMSFVKHVLDGKPLFVSEVFPSLRRGNPIIVVSMPVKKDGKIIGVAIAGIPVDRLAERVLTPVKYGQTGHLVLLDSRGMVAAHPNKELVLKKESLELFKPIIDKIVAGTSEFTLDWNGKEHIIISSKFNDKDLNLLYPWHIVFMQEKAEAFSSLRTIMFVLVVFCCLSYAVMIGIIHWLNRKTIIAPLTELGSRFDSLATGDLTVAVPEKRISNDEIGRLNRNYNAMIGNLCELIGGASSFGKKVASLALQMSASTRMTSDAVTQVAAAVSEVAAGAERQKVELGNLAQGIEKRAVANQEMSQRAEQASIKSSEVAKRAQDGAKSVEKVVCQMAAIDKAVSQSSKVVTDLGERSKTIGEIVNTITGIAKQTNLLALNAAIEAARAGENGRGFAVVAEEVKKLAEESHAAAEQIGALVTEMQSGTDHAVESMAVGIREVVQGNAVVKEAGAAFDEIFSMVKEVTHHVQDLSGVVNELVVEERQITEAVERLSAVSRSNADQAETVSAATQEQLATMEEIFATSQTLSQLAGELETAMSKFKII